jgi:CubicO group peptidase (beta-lactamase class C family)
MSNYWRQTCANPLALDFWIGLPAELNSRCATVYAAKSGKQPKPAQFYRDLATPGTLQQRTFASPHGLHAISTMNRPEIRAQPIVSLGGIGSASAIAKFYALLANGGEIGGVQFFTKKTIGQMTTTLVDGPDRIFEIPTAFSAGFMKDTGDAQRRIFGPSPKAFGHPGAGGSHAFADPENNIAFAYVMNQMEQTVLPNEKSMRLLDEIYR